MVSELLEEGAFLEEIPSISNGGRDTFDESFDGLSPLSISESDFIEEEQLSEQEGSEEEPEPLLSPPREETSSAPSASLIAAQRVPARSPEPEPLHLKGTAGPKPGAVEPVVAYEERVRSTALLRRRTAPSWRERWGPFLLLSFTLTLLFAYRWYQRRAEQSQLQYWSTQLMALEERLQRAQSLPELALLEEQLHPVSMAGEALSGGLKNQLARVLGQLFLLRAEGLHWGIYNERELGASTALLTRATARALRVATRAPSANAERAALALRLRLEVLRGRLALAQDLLDELKNPSAAREEERSLPLSPTMLLEEPDSNEGSADTAWEEALFLYADQSLPPRKAAEAFLEAREALDTPHRAYWALLALQRGAPEQVDAFRARLQERFPHTPLFAPSLHQPLSVSESSPVAPPEETIKTQALSPQESEQSETPSDTSSAASAAPTRARSSRRRSERSPRQLRTLDFEQLLARGLELLNGGRSRQAARYFEEAHRKNAQHPEPLAQLAWCALDRRQFDQAERYFNRALAVRSNHDDSLYGLAYLAERRGERAEARRRYEAYLEQHPRGARVRFVRRKLERL